MPTCSPSSHPTIPSLPSVTQVTMVKAAEAESEAKYQGMARQRQAIIAGLCDSVKDFSAGVQDINSKDVLELMWVHGPPLSPPLYADS